MNHGFPDPVSLNIWSLKDFYMNCPDNERDLKSAITNILNPVYNPTINYEMICQDPTSLNLLRASSAGEKVKRMVFDLLTNGIRVTNDQFIQFMEIAKERQTDLCELLCTMKPFNPRIASSICSSTIIGRAMKIISKINNTRTLIGLMVLQKSRPTGPSQSDFDDWFEQERAPKRSPFSFGLSYGRYEINYYNSILNIIYSPRPCIRVDEIPCSTLHAQKLRLESWGLPITGVTVAVPQEFLIWNPSDGRKCEYQKHDNHIFGYISLTSDLTQSELDSSIPSLIPVGPYRPFFGSNTKTKVQYEGGELKKVAPPILRGALDLLQIIEWGTDSDSNLSQLIRTIFSSFTDLDPQWYIPDPMSISGSLEHRWQDQRTSHGSSLSVLYIYKKKISHAC